MSDTLVLELAHHHVQAYADHSGELTGRRLDAVELRECEESIQHGVTAYRWLRRAEETLREADYRGLYRFTSEAQERIGELYRLWLEACAEIERQIDALEARAEIPASAVAFREACEDVRDLLARRDWQQRAARAGVLSGSDEPW